MSKISHYPYTEALLKRYRSDAAIVAKETSIIEEIYKSHFGKDLPKTAPSITELCNTCGGNDIILHLKKAEQYNKNKKRVDDAVRYVQTRHPDGELFGNILYECYMSPEKPGSVAIIRQNLAHKGYHFTIRRFAELRLLSVQILNPVICGIQDTFDYSRAWNDLFTPEL